MRFCSLVLVGILIFTSASGEAATETTQLATLTGTIRDIQTNEMVGKATILAEGTGRVTVANDEGEYRLRVPVGEITLVVTALGYASETLQVALGMADTLIDIALQPRPVELPGFSVYQRAYDPGQRIIIEAIRRKRDILSQLASYRFDAYTKLIIRRQDSTGEFRTISYLTETQLSGYWEKPDTYKEIIHNRRQSANLKPNDNLVTIGELLNFNQNRIDLGRYSVVSPTATDALDHYNYYLLDTLVIDGRRIFRLEVEPQSQTTPLFVGQIDIADSSFAVAGVDLGFNDVFSGGMFRNATYKQSFAPFQDSIWMPIQVRFEGEAHFRIPGVRPMGIEYLATLQEYAFNEPAPRGVINRFSLEVEPDADSRDSSRWEARPYVPLTALELYGYKRIDSLEKRPKSPGIIALQGFVASLSLLVIENDFFQFNRVEGPYVGIGIRTNDFLPNLSLSARAGYAFDARLFQQEGTLTYLFDRYTHLRAAGSVRNQVRSWPTIFPETVGSATFSSLFFKDDAFDYYRERGGALTVAMEPLRGIDLSLGYNSFRQRSLSTTTDYSFFNRTDTVRANPSVREGTDRFLSAQVRLDTRSVINNKGREFRNSEVIYTILTARSETSPVGFAGGDFHYTRYHLDLMHKLRVFDLGVFTLKSFGGLADGVPAPQHRFSLSAEASPFSRLNQFKTHADSNFNGMRALAMYASHDFGRMLFKKTGMPLLSRLPFSVQIFGGAFWSDYRSAAVDTSGTLVRFASRPFIEAGFGIGRIPPLNFQLFLTRQLSDYPESRYTISLGTVFGF